MKIKIFLPYFIAISVFFTFLITCSSKNPEFPENEFNNDTDTTSSPPDTTNITPPDTSNIPPIDTTQMDFETEKDPRAAYVNEAWAEWIKNHHYPLKSLTSENYDDIQFFKDILSGVNIIQLGESSHGVKEYNQAKVRLIKFLHEEMEFNVIAFESALFDCYYVNENIDSYSAIDAMHGSIYGVWHTYEVLPLFEYIKETQNTDNPLILAGIDMKSSGNAYKKRPEFLRSVISRINSSYASQVYELDKNLTDNINTVYWMNYIRANPDSLKAEYEKLITFFDNNIDDLITLFPENPKIPLIAQRIACCILLEIEHAQEGCNGVYPRDPSMADNLDFLIDEIYPGKKIIIWAHNSHIRHDNEKVQNSHGYNTMGTWIKERHSSELYTIGFYMYRGQTALNSRTLCNVGPPIPNSIEAIFYRARKKYLFVNLENFERDEGNGWMFSNIGAYAWGVRLESLIPNEQYNGIFFIDTVHPPDYTY